MIGSPLKWSFNVETVRRLGTKTDSARIVAETKLSHPNPVTYIHPFPTPKPPINSSHQQWGCISNGRLHFVYVRFEQTNNLLFHSCTYYWYRPFTHTTLMSPHFHVYLFPTRWHRFQLCYTRLCLTDILDIERVLLAFGWTNRRIGKSLW